MEWQKSLLPSKRVDQDVDDVEQNGNDMADNGEEYKFWLDDVSGKSKYKRCKMLGAADRIFI